ncbi:uncharacterized protein [Triticum aestivum]|uniref:uncharacterized protein n=1 Tax=Triticum aestivum TaxID=4565 RepID=UPI0003D49F32|nr:uncharacterized protein LOC123165113 [Triticum aestivum]
MHRARAVRMEGDGRKEGETPPAVARGAASLGASVQEWVQHMKASVVGVWRKATARSEQEAAEADLRAAKEQVEATDEAEAKKKRLAG